jgi:hypothetical protein
MTSWHWPYRKHLSKKIFDCCVMYLSHGQHTEHRFLITPLVRVRNLLRPLPSNGHCSQSHYLATGLYATVLNSILEKEDVSVRTGFMSIKIDVATGSCERGNELTRPMKRSN